MASVDDLDELIATRKLKGLDDGLYESDTNVASIEKKNKAEKEIEDLNDFADLLRPEQRYYTNLIKKVIEDRLKDREKIKELDKKIEKEKKLTRLAQTLTDESIKEALIEFEKDYISKQKIKDKIDEINKKYEDSKDENGESPYYYPEYTIRVLKKLLEEK